MANKPSVNSGNTVLGALVLALAIHAVVLSVVYVSDEGLFFFSKNTPLNEKVTVEFIELTPELLAVAETENDIQSLLDKYKNTTSNSNQEFNQNIGRTGFNKSKLDGDVEDDVNKYEEDLFNKFKSEREKNNPADGDNEPDNPLDKDPSDNPKDKKNTDPDSGGNYSKASSRYDFSRSHEYKKDPAYLCQLFGQIVVEIIVNRDGVVTSAKAISGDLDKDCLKLQSERYAKRWKFKSDATASKNEKGTITFTFLPQ